MIPVLNVDEPSMNKIIQKIVDNKLTVRYMWMGDDKKKEYSYVSGQQQKTKYKPASYKYANAIGVNGDLSEFEIHPHDESGEEEEGSDREGDN